MSVVRTIQSQGSNEELLRRAAERLGWTLCEGGNIALYGRTVQAKWAIKVPELRYPIAVAEHDGQLDITWDNWMSNGGHVEEDYARKLEGAYDACAREENERLAAEAERHATQQGWLTTREMREDGSVVVTVWAEGA